MGQFENDPGLNLSYKGPMAVTIRDSCFPAFDPGGDPRRNRLMRPQGALRPGATGGAATAARRLRRPEIRLKSSGFQRFHWLDTVSEHH
jgi:hypothetical protein